MRRGIRAITSAEFGNIGRRLRHRVSDSRLSYGEGAPRDREKARALKLVNARFINVDFTDYVADTSFDAVIAFDSLWHIARSAQEEIYLKLASLIKSGGYLLFTHGSRKGEITGEMYGETFYYSALDAARARELLAENGFEILTFMGNYSEPTTGTRDLLVTARKKNQSS